MSYSARAVRIGYLVLGCVLLALGVIGLVLPLMPTTIFLILAAACFGRSSPRLEAKMLAHPRFGPTLRQWREQGAISARGKTLACTGMALGVASFWFFAKPGVWLGIGGTAVFALCAAYVLSRPAPRTETPIR
ncbi:MAG TPA: YbaN family protein [Tahibacter sp.]|nr:YbaN family protein [Tahibacter sp.]